LNAFAGKKALVSVSLNDCLVEADEVSEVSLDQLEEMEESEDDDGAGDDLVLQKRSRKA